VNNSDYGDFKNMNLAGSRTAIGKEGSGKVVASGGGVMANRLVGCNVGVVQPVKGQGTMAEYCVANAMTAVFPMPDNVNIEDACSFFVNPYTAYALIETAIKHKSSGIVSTAACSQVGQMIVKLAPQFNLKVINLVRRPEQADILATLGAKHTIVTSKDGWHDELKTLVKELGVTVAVDAIAGEMTGDLLSALPRKSNVYVYGVLSGRPCAKVEPLDLIYRQKRLNGFLLTPWVMGGGGLQTLLRLNKAGNVVNEGLAREDGWCRSSFVDCQFDSMHQDFNKMMSTGGVTNKKLRMRM